MPSGRPGARTNWLAERNGWFSHPHRANRRFARRRLGLTLSLLPPMSPGFQCTLPRSCHQHHLLTLALCGPLLPIRGVAL